MKADYYIVGTNRTAFGVKFDAWFVVCADQTPLCGCIPNVQVVWEVVLQQVCVTILVSIMYPPGVGEK